MVKTSVQGMKREIFTVGHSTRTVDELAGALIAHGVRAVADIRRYPGSRRLPWFNADALAADLPRLGLQYWPFRQLGGRRRTTPQSVNGAWRNESFRGYADYMQTEEFVQALEDLMERARRTPSAIMCAEAVPWRCHRSLIADALLIRGWTVLDIYDAAKVSPHELTPFAKVRGTTIIYPAEPQATPMDQLFGS